MPFKAANRRPTDDRAILGDVALAYRRARHAGDLNPQACDAAGDRHLELWPGTALFRFAASTRGAQLIANAVIVKPRWFWHRSEAWQPRGGCGG